VASLVTPAGEQFTLTDETFLLPSGSYGDIQALEQLWVESLELEATTQLDCSTTKPQSIQDVRDLMSAQKPHNFWYFRTNRTPNLESYLQRPSPIVPTAANSTSSGVFSAVTTFRPFSWQSQYTGTAVRSALTRATHFQRMVIEAELIRPALDNTNVKLSRRDGARTRPEREVAHG
jgi:hypothetical protein